MSTTPSPYAEIEKVPLYASDQMQSRGYSVRIENPDADTGWEEVGLVSEDYLLVSNRQVRNMAQEIAHRTPLTWHEEKVFFDGKRFVYGLVTKEGARQEVSTGDVVSLGMLFENSYDGSRKLSSSLFAYRLACTNGMLMPDYFAQMRFRHERSSQGWEDEVERAMSMLSEADKGLERFANGAKQLHSLRIGSQELAALRSDVLSSVPITLWGKTVDRYLLHEEHTGWGLLNAGTNIVWHKGRSMRDFTHNETFTQGLIRYAQDHSN